MQEILTSLQAQERGFISIADALKLGLTKKERTTLYREAQLGGGLPSILVAKGSREVVWVLKSALSNERIQKPSQDFETLKKRWLGQMSSGSFTGKPLSQKYIEGVLQYGFKAFWTILREEPSIAGLNADNYSRVMDNEALCVDDVKQVDHYSSKTHIYRACVSAGCGYAINYQKAYATLQAETRPDKARNMTAHQIKEEAKRLAKNMKTGVRPHDLRRSFATILAKKGMPMTMLQLILGHEDLKTTQGYVMTNIRHVMDWTASNLSLPSAPAKMVSAK